MSDLRVAVATTELQFRVATVEDLPFIERSFLASYRNSYSAGLIAMSRWEQVMKVEWRSILARPDTRVHVAYHPGETVGDCDLYGYIVTLDGYQDHQSGRALPFIVFAYIKSAYRREHDIEAGLFAAAGIDPQAPFHYAAKTASAIRAYGASATWRPLAVRYPPAGYQQKANPDEQKRQQDPTARPQAHSAAD